MWLNRVKYRIFGSDAFLRKTRLKFDVLEIVKSGGNLVSEFDLEHFDVY